MLCSTCQSVLDEGAPKLTFSKELTWKIDELRKSAEAFCFMCDQVWLLLLREWSALTAVGALEGSAQAVPRETGTRVFSKIERFLIKTEGKVERPEPSLESPEIVIRYNGHQSRYTNDWGFADNPQNQSRIELRIRKGSNIFEMRELFCTFFVLRVKELEPINNDVDLDEDMTSASSLARGKLWLQDCQQNHRICRRIQALSLSRFLPTRLVELSEPTPSQFRLRLSAMKPILPLGLPYVTLSHCWGKAEFLTLTLATYQKLLDGMEMTKLPKTFQDAIKVAQNLGIKFIWIDSLCILQDSADDWVHEAPLMANIYGGAVCNIAASGARDSSKGIPKFRPASLVRPCIFNCKLDEGSGQCVLYPEKFFRKSFRQTPLGQRAWVVQEILLAPRVLYLNERQLFWECYQKSACESYPDGMPRSMESSGKSRAMLLTENPESLKFIRSFRPLYSGEDALKLAREFWFETVQTYNSCQLTKADDKLIALSGISQRLELLFNDRCLAGLWEKDFLPQLLWRIPKAHYGLTKRPQQYQAPSWSWASVNGVIEPGGFYCEKGLVDILAINDASMGRAASLETPGTIVLRGPLFSTRLHNLYGVTQLTDINGVVISDSLSPTNFLPDVNEEDSTNVYVLPVLVDPKFTWFRVEGLVLKPSFGRSGSFARVGYFAYNHLDIINQQSWENFPNVTPIQSLFSHSDGTYTIEII